MIEIGYSLSSEEHSPRDLVRAAAAAEKAGFGFALVSDHFHPWTDRQGESPFVWSVLGAISQAASGLEVGTGARLYSIPDDPPPIAVAAAGEHAAELAGRIGDAIVATSPDAELVEVFDESGGAGKPKYGQLTVCWAESEEEAVRTAAEWWPNAALEGELGQELALPRHFRQATATVSPGQVAAAVVCGPDPGRRREAIAEFERAGFDRVYVHQVGPEQKGFMRFYRREVLTASAVG